jgi:hypothetical protein
MWGYWKGNQWEVGEEKGESDEGAIKSKYIGGWAQ